jgi:hypothetical protein
MSMSVEFTITRPNIETNWPWSGVSGLSELNALREQYNVTSSDSESSDGLVSTWIETCPDENVNAYFNAFKLFWQQSGVNSNAANDNVTIDSRVVEG